MGAPYRPFRPKRSLDQYFLVDRAVLERERDLAEISPSDTVLEIGAGTGNLTRLLAERAGKVFAIEKDRSLATILSRTTPENVEVVVGDALKVEFPHFDKLLGNVPYSISTPLLLKVFRHRFSLGVLCLQYEFALRMVAQPGTSDYSRLSVLTALNTEKVELICRVPRTAFRPSPRVDSAVVRFVPRPSGVDKTTSEVIRMMFCHKRKTLANALKDSRRELQRLLNLDWRDAVRQVGEDRARRVLELSPVEVLEVARRIIHGAGGE